VFIPKATYRIQLNAEFPFKKAQEIVSYLQALGISHVFASPIFQARSGSKHGYDIVNPNQLNGELGASKDFRGLVKDLKEKGLYWIQDIVPNHMAYDSENFMLMDVFENGEQSAFYKYFDIDWEHPYENMNKKVLAPVLGKFYAECLENGELKLSYDEAGMGIRYYEKRFPLRIETYVKVFESNIKTLEEKYGQNDSSVINFMGALHLLKSLNVTEEETARVEQARHAKNMLRNLYETDDKIRAFVDETIVILNGREGDTASFDRLDELISEQRFRLSFWKVAGEEINYRRFFTINDLICLRIEDIEVFEYTHKLILELVHMGMIDGLRIDHIDGLYDPTRYLKTLREKAGDIYIVVEKILERSEKLYPPWQVQGTTGYDFLNAVNSVFCMKDNRKLFMRAYYKFTNFHTTYEDLMIKKKRLIIGKHIAGYIDNLAQWLKNISSKDRYGRDITLYGLRKALVEVMAHFPVYRTYVNFEDAHETDMGYIKEAIDKSREKSPELVYELAFIEKFMLLNYDANVSDDGKGTWIQFIMSFQQQTGALMAKGFEDTLLYVYNMLLSLNEVGGSPHHFGMTIDEFHEFNKERFEDSPYTMNTTSTHDTKRGEDIRARINVLSELPIEWEYHLKLWRKINRNKKKRGRSYNIPDANDEYFLYQTLLGAYPCGADSDMKKGFLNRIKEYIRKAVREAKVHTAWIKPDEDYEESYLSFIEKILEDSEENMFMKSFLPFHKRVVSYGIFNSLSQTMIKITGPGIPAFYQGAELWDLNLVDPDNRRQVDFKYRKNVLAHIKEKENSDMIGLIEELYSTKGDGRIKMFLTYRVLKARGDNLHIFEKGTYLPIKTEGKHKDCAIAFARRHENSWAIIIAPRYFSNIIKDDEKPLGGSIWGDTRIILPDGAPSKWIDVVTGQECNNIGNIGNILGLFSTALLVS